VKLQKHSNHVAEREVTLKNGVIVHVHENMRHISSHWSVKKNVSHTNFTVKLQEHSNHFAGRAATPKNGVRLFMLAKT
jgi:hypothetical protein